MKKYFFRRGFLAVLGGFRKSPKYDGIKTKINTSSSLCRGQSRGQNSIRGRRFQNTLRLSHRQGKWHTPISGVHLLFSAAKYLAALILLVGHTSTHAVVVSSDNFSSGGFSGGSGWADPSWATTGSPAVVSFEVSAPGGADDRSITRTVDLTGYSSAIWSMDWRCIDSGTGFEPDDQLFFQVSYGGGAFVTLQTITEPCAAAFSSESDTVFLALTGGDSNTQIRALASASFFTENLFLDNVVIDGELIADTDGDTIFNDDDIDDDNDGILDTEEQDGLLDRDTDGDGFVDRLDIDSDNDGIPDNIEAQTTGGYITPSGVGAGITDAAPANGLDDNYETAQGGTDLLPVDSDGDNVDDYIDLDSDGEGIPDTVETAITGSGIAGSDDDSDGLLNDFEGANTNDGFVVNDEITDPATDLVRFPDEDNDCCTTALLTDVDYRDLDLALGLLVPTKTGTAQLTSSTTEVADNDLIDWVIQVDNSTGFTLNNVQVTDILTGDHTVVSTSFPNGWTFSTDTFETDKLVVSGFGLSDGFPTIPVGTNVTISATGGDGFIPVFGNDGNIYTSYHHKRAIIQCVEPSTGALCSADYPSSGRPLPPTGVAGLNEGYMADNPHSSFFIGDQYYYPVTHGPTGQQDNTSVFAVFNPIDWGLGCYDVNTLSGCSGFGDGGYLALGGDTSSGSSFTGNITDSAIQGPYLYNNNIYMFDVEGEIHCVTQAGSLCGGAYPLDISDLATYPKMIDDPGTYNTATLTGQLDGSRLYTLVSYVGKAVEAGGTDVEDYRVRCTDLATDSNCSGWPAGGVQIAPTGRVTQDSDANNEATAYESYLRKTTAGVVDAICLYAHNGGVGCVSSSNGVPIADGPSDFFGTPDALHGVLKGGPTGQGMLHALEVGTQLYMGTFRSDGNYCWDFATNDFCAVALADDPPVSDGFFGTGGFLASPAAAPDSEDYGPARDPNTGCFWSLGDNNELWNYDIFGNSPCLIGQISSTQSLEPEAAYCATGAAALAGAEWDELAILDVDLNQFTSLDVDLFDVNDTLITSCDFIGGACTDEGFGVFSIVSSGQDHTVDLSSLSVTGNYTEVRAEMVGLLPLGTELEEDGADPRIELRWDFAADPPPVELCLTTDPGLVCPATGSEFAGNEALVKIAGANNTASSTGEVTLNIFSSDPMSCGFVSGSIGDRVWLDEDGDGVQDAGEDGISNVTVTLTPPSGVDIGAGPSNPITTITDINGHYIFTDIPPGDYTVAVSTGTLPGGLTNQTGDPDASLDSVSTATVVGGQFNDVQDFGYNYATPTATDNPGAADTGAIGDRIWIDANGDGIQDPGESGLGGIGVVLAFDSDGDGVVDEVLATTTTDGAGNYVFDGLDEGIYDVIVVGSAALPTAGDDVSTVTATVPTAYTQTGDPDSTSDNQTTTPIILGPGDVFVNADFGYQPSGSSSTIGDTIYLDSNGDGNEDVGEPGIPGVSVSLLVDTTGNGTPDTVIATTMTDENGNYAFPGLPAEDYQVVVTDINNILDGLEASDNPPGDITLDQSGPIIVIDGVSDSLDQDFGFVTDGHTAGQGLIGDTIYLDANGDGDQDTGESGLAGVVVQIFDATGSTLLATTTTNDNGNYYFGSLDSTETYQIQVDTSTLPNGGTGLINTEDPDLTGGAPDAGDSISTVDLNVSGPVNLDQDFGYVASTPNTIGGTVWQDTNADGTLNEASAIGGVTVALFDSSGNLVGTTTTDPSGNYSFTGLPDGTYTVDVTDTDDVLNSYWHSDGANDGADNNSQTDPYSITVTGGETDTTGDFGYYVAPGTIGNFIWHDLDYDGVFDVGEPGIDNVEVTLTITYPNGDVVILTTTTDPLGSYSFANLLADEDYNGITGSPSYSITVYSGSGSPMDEWTSSYDDGADTAGIGNGTDNNADNNSGEAAFPPQGGTDATNDFAFVPLDKGDITSATYGAANHTIIDDLSIGAAPDPERLDQSNPAASGDDSGDQGDDEDGVVFTSPGGGAHNEINVSVGVINSVSPATPATLCVSVDYTYNGSFDDTVCAAANITGTFDVGNVPGFNFTGFPNATGTAVFRARLCLTGTGCELSTSANAIGGEVEDYTVAYNFVPTAVTISNVDLSAISIAEYLSQVGLSASDFSNAELLELIASLDPGAAERLAGASRKELLAALKDLLDPDDDDKIAVFSWGTLEERGTVGFFVERRTDDESSWQQINSDMLPSLLSPLGGQYRLIDPGAVSGNTYQYRLIEQEADGNTNTYGPYTLEIL